MKTVLITGGLSGIGSALADIFIAAGFLVVVTSRQLSFSDSFKKPLIKQHLDVCDKSSVDKLFAWLDKHKLQVDVLFNNAGVGIFKPLIEWTEEEFDIVMNTNFKGTFLCTQAAIIRMKKQGGGRIINLGSIIEQYPRPLNAIYGASKAAIQHFSAHLMEELKEDKICITHVYLGATATGIWQSRPYYLSEKMLSPQVVAQQLFNIAILPLEIRMDSLEILPNTGVL